MGMKLTYYGHSCFGIEINGVNLLVDPFVSGNPLASHIDVSTIPADYVLISHGHQDHVLDVESVANRTGAKLISNFEIINWFSEKGLKNGHSMNHGGGYDFDFGRVHYVSAIHSSSMPDGSYGGNPGGFVITPKGSRSSIYYSGDTALSYDMKLIGEQFDIFLALLPIGDNYTMGVTDAVRCSEFVGASKIVGLHYNTFPPIQTNLEQASRVFSQSGKDLILLEIGQVLDLS